MEKNNSDYNPSAFQYFISEKNGVIVITFVGDMMYYAGDGIDACRLELEAKKNIKLTVLYFRDVNQISTDALPKLALLQKQIRNLSPLRICSLKPNIKDKLVRSGLVRGTELSDNLQSALSIAKTLANKIAA